MIRKNSAFTLVEILVVAVLAICLVGILAPALKLAFTEALSTRCAGNLRVLGQATLLYAAEHDMVLPATDHQAPDGSQSWTNVLQPYASGQVTFKCPCDENRKRNRTYVMNDFLAPNPCGAPFLDFSRLSSTGRHMDIVLYVEAAASSGVPDDHFHFSDYFQQNIPASEFSTMVAVNRHGGKANYLYVDAHVETLGWKEVQALLAQPTSRFIDPTR